MALQRVNFFQRNSAGGPLVGATITTSELYDDGSAAPVIGNATELDGVNQPGMYYFDVNVSTSKILTVVTDAGAGVTDDNNRYTAFVLTDTPNTPANVADAVWDEAVLGHIDAGSFGLTLGLLPGSVAALPTAAQNADAVWDEATAGHVTAGTFGEFVQYISMNTWQVAATSFSGPMGTSMGRLSVLTLESADAAPALTWDVDLASHVNSGSTGEALNDLATGSTPAAIATAVWSALVASNQAVGSFGEAVTILQALSHRNWRLTGATYSGSPARLTSATLVLYPTKADALANTNAILTQAFTATYDSNGEMTASIQTDL